MSDTDRDKLIHILFDQVPEDWDENDIGILADAILAEFLPEHDKQVRRDAAAEQRERDAAQAESFKLYQFDAASTTGAALAAKAIAAAIREQETE